VRRDDRRAVRMIHGSMPSARARLYLKRISAGRCASYSAFVCGDGGHVLFHALTLADGPSVLPPVPYTVAAYVCRLPGAPLRSLYAGPFTGY